MTSDVFDESIAAFFGEMLVARGFRLFSEEIAPKTFGNQIVVMPRPRWPSGLCATAARPSSMSLPVRSLHGRCCRGSWST